MKVIKWIVKFLYRISGLAWVVSEIDIRISAYRIRLNIVPVSYKLFILALGVAIGSSSMYVAMSYESVLVIENASVPVIVEPVKAESPDEVAIWEEGEFSAYTASVDETDASPHIMASGKKVYTGAIACPSRYQFGEKIEVQGLGIFTCEDRMNARYRESNHFDIYIPTKAEAFEFGRQALKYQSK